MREKSFLNRRSVSTALSLSVAALVASGCKDREIKTYRVAKEAAPEMPQMGPQGIGSQAPQTPHVHADAPEGWVEQQPDRMRVASYMVKGENGQMAEVAIIPLPGVNNIETESVNMWREELQLPPAEKGELKPEQVTVGPMTGNLYDFAGASPKAGEQFKNRTLGVVAQGQGVTWFIKMMGADALVREQKPAFVQFLKGLSFHASSHDQVAAKRPVENASGGNAPVSTNTKELPPGSDLPKWKVPPTWQEKAPGPMLLAAFGAGEEGKQAEVTVSRLPGEAGGMAANVNRWRSQLGLQPLGPGEMTSAVVMIEIGGEKAYTVDIKGVNGRTGKEARMVAVGLPQGDQTWFYKMMGDEAVVGKEKDAFIRFIQSAY